MKFMKLIENEIVAIFLAIVIVISALAGCVNNADIDPDIQVSESILKFESAQDIVDVFEEVKKGQEPTIFEEAVGIAKSLVGARQVFGSVGDTMVMETSVAPTSAGDSAGSGRDFSETNIQVKGVDEADIIKTDGDYIYAVANNKMYIAKAYPAEEAEVLSIFELDGFSPREMFIHEDRLIVFGYQRINYKNEPEIEVGAPVKIAAEIMPYPYFRSSMAVKLFDTTDKTNPELLRTVDFEGNYITSRKIGDNVYFVVNSNPHYNYDEPIEIMPLYKEDDGEAEPIVDPTDVGYIEPLHAVNFITVASISMTDENKEVGKEVIVGNGQNVYSSVENLYIAQTTYPRYDNVGELMDGFTEKTVITKFKLDDGDVSFLGTGEVKGHILNQFSMDEYDNHFRIATTAGRITRTSGTTSNNVYVLDSDLELVGSLEDLAPGESIYSVRFMGKKGYVVTFVKIDPLFVIDLSDHTDPTVLGKLKIPGYSDYLHPYDETHIIGIGKDTEASDKGDFAWYQGVKMAIFDVSDVENPIEMHKVIIGDRGTESPVLQDHKAFLFDREKNLLVLPVRVAEIKGEKSRDNQYGEFVFQGAYVYDVGLDEGFDLRGKVSHNTEEDYLKSGRYMSYDKQIQRSLYIDDVLYTMSQAMLKMNDLGSLEELNSLSWE